MRVTRQTLKPRPAVQRPPAYAVTPAREAHGTLETHERADPDRPQVDELGVQIGYHTVIGARVRSGADYLFRLGTISVGQCAIAERYVATVERMHGARDGDRMTAGRAPPHRQGSPTEDQVNAASDLRKAVDGVGEAGMGLIGAVMLDGATLTGMGILLDEDKKSVGGRLRGALDRLMEVWGG